MIFRIGEIENQTFDTLKTCLTSEPILAILILKTELHTDASSKGFGAILMQLANDNRYHPIYYYSAKTS